MTDELTKIQRIARVSRYFTPSAPVSTLATLAGRRTKIMDVVTAVSQRGQHAALYGERGVGKTSLANIIVEVFAAAELPDIQGAKVNCNTETTYESLWRAIFRELGIPLESSPTPEDVRYVLGRLDTPAVIVIDELDRLEDDESLSLLSDTVKSLSDHAVESTLVLVGVASSVEGLVGEHESVERAIVQIEMPRMSLPELREILEKGCESSGLRATQAAIDKITTLSEGLPHFTHLLGLHAAERVVQNDRNEIELGDVNAAIEHAVAKHTIRSDYLKAIRSPRSDNLYPDVLLACALAPKDPLGYFKASAIREPLRVIADRNLGIPAFARHLKQFLEPHRGCVLHRDGVERSYVYRFSNPLLQPYTILNGLAEGLITDEQLVEIQGAEVTEEESIGLQRLF